MFVAELKGDFDSLRFCAIRLKQIRCLWKGLGEEKKWLLRIS